MTDKRRNKNKNENNSVQYTYTKEKEIKVNSHDNHSKGSERYLDVIFTYEDGKSWEGYIPIEDRRAGINLSDSLEINKYLEKAYDFCNPEQTNIYIKEQEEFWLNSKAPTTKPLFEKLLNFRWNCVCCVLPGNPNPARRYGDLKDKGYRIPVNTSKKCETCQKNTTHIILVPLPRHIGFRYELWNLKLREIIFSLLDTYDVYEGKKGNKDNLLPDHKFPEIRWDSNTTRESLEHITDEEIKNDFQLLSNQRNQQKREVCRFCYQTGKRGTPFGVKFYYQGDESWPDNIPKIGKEAEKGCQGSGWYDLETWRKKLNQKLNDSQEQLNKE